MQAQHATATVIVAVTIMAMMAMAVMTRRWQRTWMVMGATAQCAPAASVGFSSLGLSYSCFNQVGLVHSIASTNIERMLIFENLSRLH